LRKKLKYECPPVRGFQAGPGNQVATVVIMLEKKNALRLVLFALICVVCGFVVCVYAADGIPSPSAAVLDRVQARMVKVYGAGGYRGLEAYQSGMLVSPEGHILTAYSHVLDTDYITVYSADGRKYEAKFVGADPRIEAALLKIDCTGLPYFDLGEAVSAAPGDGVLAVSNLFNVAIGDEQASVQHGVVSAVTRLEARRGAFETPYRGPVYVLDAKVNNPGSAGGALLNARGELLGMLGKELRNSLNNTWLNYAIPLEEIRPSVEAIRSGKFVAAQQSESGKKPSLGLTPEALGIVLVPDVLPRTPPYVDQVRAGSPAEKAGIRPDDLVVLLGDRLIQSCKMLRAELEYVDAVDSVKVTVLRDGEMLSFMLAEAKEADTKDKKAVP
jgi:S1-C subfamily serine protease